MRDCSRLFTQHHSDAPALAVPVAVASGVGAGVMQTLVMNGDVLGGAMLPGTLYKPSCTQLSVFGVDALSACAFMVLNVLLSILGWTMAYPQHSMSMYAAILGLHYLASGVTLLHDADFMPPGQACMVVLPILYAVVAFAGVLTACVAGRRILKATESSGPGR